MDDDSERSLSNSSGEGARAAVERAIAQHEGRAASFGAYRAWCPDDARSRAAAIDTLPATRRGALHGIPTSVKDLYGVDGFDTFAGSPKALPANPWARSGPIVRRLLEQGAVVMGKTHTVEFAFGGLGINPHWPHTANGRTLPCPRNPWSVGLDRVPGGSSSGAGVSLCAGSADLAIGTDTAGSVRIPASWTGNVGLKISHGRWSLDHVVPLSPSLDSPGLLTRDVRNAAMAFTALDLAGGAAPRALPRTALRLGLLGCAAAWSELSPGVGEGVEAAIGELGDAGMTTRDIAAPEATAALELFYEGGVAGAEFHAFLNRVLSGHRETLAPIVADRLIGIDAMSAREYLDRQLRAAEIARSCRRWFENVDVVVLPTVAISPPLVDELDEPDTYRCANLLALRNTSIANYIDVCALTLPVALDEVGMPIGLQLLGPRNGERELLAAALTIESVLGCGESRIGCAAG